MNKIALITGASSGIGKDLAIIHASKGGDLILVARREEKLKDLQTEITEKYKVKVELIMKDLANPKAARELYDEILSKGIAIDYLINNAGFGGQGFFHERDWEAERDMINLNVMTLTELTHLFLPQMIERNSGKILQVASSAAFVPGGPLQSVYYATKAYVLSFTQGLAGELTDTNVTVTALCPGATATEFEQTAGLEHTGLFSGKNYDSFSVAHDGYKAMMKGQIVKPTALPLSMRITMKLMPFLPKKLVLKQIREMQEVRN
ncbi:MAG: SDR family oxidoreductase [Bacteroidales bacterium]|nr:SDR family oxidoreductase [Bacteroidales bacterium]